MRPILFEIFGFPIHSYGFMLACGFLAGLALARKLAPRFRGVDPDSLSDMVFFTLLLSVVGARVVFVINDWPSYARNPGEIFKIWSGGLSFHGGFIGGALAVFLFARMKKIPFLELGDLCVAPLALGYMFGRTGCLLNGCCYGRPSDAPWAMVVPALQDGVHRHPTQVYAILLNLAMVLVLIALGPRRKRAGDLVAAYFVFYAVERFVMETFRKGSSSILLESGFTLAQYVSLLMLFIGAAVALAVRKWSPAIETDKKKNAPAEN